MKGEPGFMGIPGKVGPSGDPGFPGMKGKAGPRGELRACAGLIPSSREGSGGTIPAHHRSKPDCLKQLDQAPPGREFLALGTPLPPSIPRTEAIAASSPWILPLISHLCIVSVFVGVGFALRSPFTHLLHPEMKNHPFHP